MKRPILIATLGFITGIIGGLYFDIIPFIFVGILACIMKYMIKNKYKRLIKVLITNNVVILFSLFLIIGHTYILYLEKDYEKTYYSLEKVKVLGTIISEKEEKEYNDIYKIRVEKLNGKKVNYKDFLLSIKKTYNKQSLKYGDTINFVGEYIKPEEQRNYKGFDYSRYLKTLKIYGTIKVNNKLSRLKENDLSFISLLSNKVRNKIINNVNQIFPQETKGIFLGILLGYDNLISEDIKQNFSDSSLSHLLAVSGAHVSYIVLGLALFFKLIKIPKKLNKILIGIFLIFYLYLINFTASVTRAVIMSIISIFQVVFYRKQDTTTTISFSSLLILIQNPYKIFNIGFLLSYFGTIGIIVFIDKLMMSQEKKNKIKIIENLKNLCIVTISAQLLIFPIVIYYFNTLSLTFIISNLIAGLIIGPITIIGLIIIILSFLNLSFTSIIAKFYNILLVILLNTTKIISNIPLSKIYVKTPNTIFIILYDLIILFLNSICIIKQSDRIFLKKKIEKIITDLKCAIKNNKTKILIIFLLILILFYIFSKIPKNLKIYFIDVGQGDSCLIVTPMNKKILIDSGGSESYDVGKNTLFPYLLDRGITSLDYIFISHFDTDHCKGFEYILENMKVKNIIISKQTEVTENFKTIYEMAKRKNTNIMVASKGDIINLDKYSKLEIFSPDSKNKLQDINDSSIVAKFTAYNFSILLTGDASQSIEKELMENKDINLKSTVLKVSHHGSKTGTSKKFLEKVKPRFALIGVGKNNKFGHPTQEVIQRLQENNIKIYRTDEMGEIDLTVNRKGKIKIKSIVSN